MPEIWRLGATKAEQRECDRLEAEAMALEKKASEIRKRRKLLLNKYFQRALKKREKRKTK